MCVTRVSNHAVLRWLDRIEHIGIDGLRMRLGLARDDEYSVMQYLKNDLKWDIEKSRIDLMNILNKNNAPSEGRFTIGRADFRIKEGTVVTIVPSH